MKKSLSILVFILFIGLTIVLLTGKNDSKYKYVNTLFGAAYTDRGNTIVGPQAPWGACNPGPDCSKRQWMTDGYDVDLPIRGFSQLHTDGAGGPGHYGNFLFSPQIGLNTSSKGHFSEKEDEVTKCAYYAVTLSEYDIRTEITANKNSSMYRFTYPESKESSFVIDMSHSIPGNVTTGHGYMLEGELSILPESRKIQGWGKFIGGWCSTPYHAYFVAEFSKDFKSSGVWRNDTLDEQSNSIQLKEGISLLKYDENIKQMVWNPEFTTPDRIGGFITFDTKEEEEILVKVGVSLNSVEQADKLLQAEIRSWEFDKIRTNTERLWEEQLNKITISLGDDFQGINNANDYEVFYTAMYHMMLMPRDRSMDAPEGWDKDTPFLDDFSALWDTYRTLFPLMTLINPELEADVINYFSQLFQKEGFVNDGVQAQKIRIYSIGAPNQPFRYRWNQGGDAIDNIVGDAFVKHLPGVDWQAAYAMIKYNAEHLRANTYREDNRGWIPDEGGEISVIWDGLEHVSPVYCNVSQALEMNLNDYCVAQVAQGLGYDMDAKKYLKRSGNWIETWNPDVTLRKYIEEGNIKNAFGRAKNLGQYADTSIWDYKGWFGSRNLKGEFVGPGEYHESPLTDYVFFVPHNMHRLVEMMGGKERFIERLDKTKIAAWNEPGFLALRAYYYAGRPDKAMPRIRETMRLWTEDGGVKYPGDDDSGAMSSWFIWSALGFFPNAGMDYYFINGPLYPEANIQLGNGKSLTIKGENASWENCYIQSMTVNGEIYKKSWISHKDLMSGGTIEFVMGKEPSDWGKDSDLKEAEQVPSPTFSDVAYGPNPKQVLNFWKADTDGPSPLLFFIHGG